MSTLVTLMNRRTVLPDVRGVHWLFRILLAAIIFQQAMLKTPISATDAESIGVPMALWVLAAVGEFGAAIALIIGGLMRNAIGDLLTRAGGLTLALITLSVIYVVYWAPPMDIFLSNQLHLLMVIGGLYFATRGNNA